MRKLRRPARSPSKPHGKSPAPTNIVYVKRGKINFAAFNVSKFICFLFTGISVTMRGCGATALGLLTGANPHLIPKREDWDSRYMLRYLREKGFIVAKLTTKKLVTSITDIEYPINERHVVLASLRFIKGEASWVVIHNDIMYHNFEISKFRPYEQINHPVVEIFLLQHPNWR